MTSQNPDITFSEAGEIFHMSGPWMGKLHWRNSHIVESVMLDSVTTDLDRKRIYFLRCNMQTKWRKDVFFSLCFIKTDSEQIFEIKHKLPSTSFPEITTDLQNDDIIHVRFHEKNFVLNLNECSIVSL
ncbi:MAG: hypothetical protein RIE52_03725 [Balneola sp.]|jgi:hypothetical protein